LPAKIDFFLLVGGVVCGGCYSTSWQEKVEEDRYMRAQEDQWKEKLRVLKAQQADEHDKEVHDAVVNPVILHIEAMLKETNDKISPAALEKLAKWKIDL
jgi:hypothetical protein